MKHLIITRFYCTPFALTDEELMDDKYLKPGLVNLKKYLIASLENQTVKNFTLAIAVHNQLQQKRPDVFNELHSLKTSFPIDIVQVDLLSKYIDSLNECNIIESRIDIDDCVFNRAVELIQEKQNWDQDFMFFAFMNGATMLDGQEINMRQFVSPTYDGWSSLSIFPTFFVKWDKHHIIPIYNHTKLLEFCNKNNIQLQHGVNHFYDYDIPCAWLYVQHSTNVSLLKSHKRHQSNVKLSYDSKTLNSLFGIGGMK